MIRCALGVHQTLASPRGQDHVDSLHLVTLHCLSLWEDARLWWDATTNPEFGVDTQNYYLLLIAYFRYAALEIILDLPFGFPINNIISLRNPEFGVDTQNYYLLLVTLFRYAGKNMTQTGRIRVLSVTADSVLLCFDFATRVGWHSATCRRSAPLGKLEASTKGVHFREMECLDMGWLRLVSSLKW